MTPACELSASSGSALHAPIRSQVKESLKRLMGSVHVSITAACAEYLEKFRRHVYVTPKSYMAFLEGYQGLYTKKLGETRLLAGAINSGLQKMDEAKVDVNRMKVGGLLRSPWSGQTLLFGPALISQGICS